MSTSEFLNPSNIMPRRGKPSLVEAVLWALGHLASPRPTQIDACGIPHQLRQTKMSPYIAKCPQGGTTASTREPPI